MSRAGTDQLVLLTSIQAVLDYPPPDAELLFVALDVALLLLGALVITRVVREGPHRAAVAPLALSVASGVHAYYVAFSPSYMDANELLVTWTGLTTLSLYVLGRRLVVAVAE